MAILSINELHQNRRSSYSGGKLKHTRAFQVTCDDPRDGTATALVAATISFARLDNPAYEDLDSIEFGSLVDTPRYEVPLAGGAYPTDWTCMVTSVEAEPVKDSDVVFVVTVEYESVGDETAALHPLSRPATFSYQPNEFTEPYFLDESTPKRPMANSAGDPFENSSEREQATLAITMVRNEATFVPIQAVQIANTTNKEAVTLDGTVYPPDTLKISMPSAQKQLEYYGGAPVNFYSVTRTFKAREDTHVDRIQDWGYNELAYVPGPSGVPVLDRVPIMDPAGGKVSRPWPLDGSGYAIPSPSGAPAVLSRRPYRSVSWASMNLE